MQELTFSEVGDDFKFCLMFLSYVWILLITAQALPEIFKCPFVVCEACFGPRAPIYSASMIHLYLLVHGILTSGYRHLACPIEHLWSVPNLGVGSACSPCQGFIQFLLVPTVYQ